MSTIDDNGLNNKNRSRDFINLFFEHETKNHQTRQNKNIAKWTDNLLIIVFQILLWNFSPLVTSHTKGHVISTIISTRLIWLGGNTWQSYQPTLYEVSLPAQVIRFLNSLRGLLKCFNHAFNMPDIPELSNLRMFLDRKLINFRPKIIEDPFIFLTFFLYNMVKAFVWLE